MKPIEIILKACLVVLAAANEWIEINPADGCDTVGTAIDVMHYTGTDENVILGGYSHSRKLLASPTALSGCTTKPTAFFQVLTRTSATRSVSPTLLMMKAFDELAVDSNFQLYFSSILFAKFELNPDARVLNAGDLIGIGIEVKKTGDDTVYGWMYQTYLHSSI